MEEVKTKSKNKRLHKLGKDTFGDYVIIAFLVLFALIAFYPIWYVIIGSLSEGTDYMNGGVNWWPRKFTFANYQAIFSHQELWDALLITIVRCCTGPTLLVFFTSLVAYGMSRKELYFKKFFNIFGMITMFIGGGMIPLYVVESKLGLLNTFWIYIIPGMYNVYDMILIRSFFKGSPEELHEAAVVDGAGEFRIYFTIMIPVTMPILATILMWGLIGHWNDYLTTEIYCALRPDLYTLQYVLRTTIAQSGQNIVSDLPTVMQSKTSQATVSHAAMMFGTIPILLVYPFLQKYFTRGLFVGSLKG